MTGLPGAPIKAQVRLAKEALAERQRAERDARWAAAGCKPVEGPEPGPRVPVAPAGVLATRPRIVRERAAFAADSETPATTDIVAGDTEGRRQSLSRGTALRVPEGAVAVGGAAPSLVPAALAAGPAGQRSPARTPERPREAVATPPGPASRVDVEGLTYQQLEAMATRLTSEATELFRRARRLRMAAGL